MCGFEDSRRYFSPFAGGKNVIFAKDALRYGFYAPMGLSACALL